MTPITHRHVRSVRIAGALALALWTATACANPEDVAPKPTDAGEVERTDAGPAADAGVVARHVLEQSSLAPAAQSASTPNHQLRGHLRSSDVREATNGNHRIRGGFVPLAR